MDDKDLRASDVQLLVNLDGIASFFATLGYNTEARLPQTSAALGITADSLQRQIRHIEQIAVQQDPADPLYVFVVELSSVTVAATQGLARALRNRGGNYLLVLTDDYERLDFVLLERSLPVENGTAMSTRQVPIRPRVLTVRRRDPSQVELRVLRRFTYTESDATAQYEKLQSAYTVAEWSKPFFNNLALFSDYYLTERLPGQDEWRERPEDAYQNLRQLMSGALERLSGKTVDVTRSELIEPAFEALGFGKASVVVQPEAGDADYLLYRKVDDDKPIAICLAYTWNRSLDSRDDTRDPESDENPGARVVSALDSREAPWAIVTNGKLWRLYSAKTHSRATNYYEIDLEETLAMKDPNLAFRYFWLMFRSRAFVPREMTIDGQAKEMSFLDQLLQGSEDYAKALGDRLKVRVFEDIFPHFAEGYIEYLKGQVGLAGAEQGSLLPMARQMSLKQEPDEEFRRLVFQGTLTLLYRLLFLLYSESRGLLPVKEERGYWEQSITKLKEDIAEKAQNIKDEAPGRLRKAYRASSDATDLYDRLLKLFASVDRGNRDLNLPHYNGGLFNSQPEDGDRSQDAESARFLLENKIPDRYLALGLDLLARDVDDKRQDLVFIDYKSLGVRQLGSIYEGLLEFKIRLAPEKMAIVKGKRSEEVISYNDAQASGKKVLTIGRGKNAQERIYQKGDVYLENDRSERKATGSYYTPDHIVKYIVENTVGPVLQEKFKKLRSKFRDTQLRYREAVKHDATLHKKGIRSNEASKVAGGEPSRKLVDDLFDLKVLDPAMGSGHFLVEAVDYISDQFLGQKEGFLRPFIWNPVTEFLRQTRDEIVQEMEHQGVSIDASRLTDVNLLKRHVLKRCVYGVDLNPMAVELAKVSLWLDCFTIGAPLSFLDHHLKCGNSLIGTTVEETEAERRTKENNTYQLFGGAFHGILNSTRTMLEIARTPDVTIAESEKSRQLFGDFEKGMVGFKRLLGLSVSRHFGNKGAESLLDFSDSNLVERLKSGGQGLPPDQFEIAQKAIEVGDDMRFFHWDLEFPEAYIDLEGNDWKSKDDQGFDAVVGNPPYVDIKGLNPEDTDILFKFFETTANRANIYAAFMERGSRLLRLNGVLGMIVPNSWMTQSSYVRLRDRVVSTMHVRNVVRVPETTFPEQKVETIVICASLGPPKSPIDQIECLAYPDDMILHNIGDPGALVQGIIRQNQLHGVLSDLWLLASGSRDIIRKIEISSVPLESICEFSLGLTPYDRYKGHSADLIERRVFHSSTKEDDTFWPLLEGGDIQRFGVQWNGGSWISYGPWLGAPRQQRFFEEPRILVKQIIDWTSRRIHAAFTDDRFCNSQIAFNLLPSDDVSCHFLLAVINSRLLTYYHKNKFLDPVKQRFQKILIQDARHLPIRRIEFVSPQEELHTIVDELVAMYRGCDHGSLIESISSNLPLKSDAVHDLLVFLALQMTEYHRLKNAEIDRFLRWLKIRLLPNSVEPNYGMDSFSNKVQILNFLGDYQKGEEITPFESLWEALTKNMGQIQRRLDVSFQIELRREYDQVLSVLRPIRKNMVVTDRLIDQIIYQLYGLTDSEIDLVEGTA